MEYSSTTLIVITVILVVVAALFVWFSLTMAAAEGAVARVTRASLNNLILEVQTDSESSQFIKMKKIDKIHRVQRLIADRYATAGSCAFFRIACNVLDVVYSSPRLRLYGAPSCGLVCSPVSCSRLSWPWSPYWCARVPPA